MTRSDQDQPTDSAAHNGSAVAALLHSSRQRCGEDLREVSAVLCIRYPYLLAMEEGRFGDLPGPTYAAGFVRAYADHLGLDGDEVLRRFKAETEGLRNSAKLAFPMPASEERIPTAAMIFMGVVLAAVAYGGWFWMSTSDRPLAEFIPAVPEPLLALLKSEPAPAPTEVAAEPAASESPTTVASPAQVAALPVTATPEVAPALSGQPTAPPAATVPPSEPAPAMTAPPATLVKTPAAITPPPVVPKPSVEMAGMTPPEEEDEVPPAPSTTAQATPRPAAVAMPVAVVQPPPPAAPAAAPDRVYGDLGTDVRIVVRAARGDSWIDVRDKQRSLGTRLLRKGESFRVPNRTGLALSIGNAGAVDVVVDGVATPTLGAVGKARRNVPLDIERLRKGIPEARPVPAPSSAQHADKAPAVVAKPSPAAEAAPPDPAPTSTGPVGAN